ncbi:MAG: ATP-dependent RNA helicase HrpA, partial [Actinomycetota bacterium]
ATVSGRTYPVEVRYRPFGADRDDLPEGVRDQRDQVQAVIDAVDELADEGDGDVLVFFSGEREIHDATDALRRRNQPGVEILPLYARLSAPEQQRIFQRPGAGTRRRIVLATNVAETSITVPGVRYVVDTGTARISRYSKRLKVQRLPIEPVSKASANQRAGRCGRVAPGICIRLYTEDDFDARDDFTEPEILRTNLASVILQMANIGLGDLGRFPFVEPPDARTIRDGELLLEELGAIAVASGASRAGPIKLTKLGRRLARLPIDPRLGRMLLEADRRNCVREVLVIVAALSIQDVRERPAERREKANEFHNRFKVKGSDLLSILSLWNHLRSKQRELSGNQFRRMCRSEYLHYLRVREWMDLHAQLRRALKDVGIRMGTEDGHPDHVHQALLTGLLAHVGMRDRDRRVFKGARQAEFVIAPGSVLTRKPVEWVVAAELVETNQIYARRVAEIDPRWAEKAGAHLVKRSYGDARWDPKGGRAVCTEQVTLYGLPLVSDRVIGYDRVDPDAARAWFITKALVEGEVAAHWAEQHRFLEHNSEVLSDLSSFAARVRGTDLVDDDALFGFYDDRIPDDITSTQHFDRWWKRARRDDATLLDLTDRRVATLIGDRAGGVDLGDFPDAWRQGDLELPLTYRYAPGEPLDGVTIHVPLTGLNQVTDDGFDWQIPGRRDELVEVLMRSLPKQMRREMIPFAETVHAVLDRLGEPAGRVVDRLAAVSSEVAGIRVRASDFDTSTVPDDLRLHIVVSDDDGEVHDVGTDLRAIKDRLAGTARESIAAAAPIEERRGLTTWDVGDLQRVIESSDRGFDVRAYPTLLDVGSSVSLRVVTTEELQERAMRGGVRRLLLLDAAPKREKIERLITNAGRLALAGSDIDVGELVDDCIAAAVDQVLDEWVTAHGGLPWTEAAYRDLRAEVTAKTSNRAGVALGKAAAVVAAAARVHQHTARLIALALRPSVDDANAHLGRLVRPGFVSASGVERLDDIERYVRGIAFRLEHLAGSVQRDQARMAEVAPLEARYAGFVDRLASADVTAEVADLSWTLEELRLQVFAQPVGPKPGTSLKRVHQALAAVGA